MKKILLSLLVLAASANIFAAINYNAGADIQIKGNTSKKSHLFTVVEITDANPGQYCAEMYEGTFGSAKVAFFAIADSKKYEIFASNDIDGQALGVKTYTDTEYTLTFSNLRGEGKLYLVDAVADKFIEITEGGSYAFTAEANQTIADRFSIAKNLPYLFVDGIVTIGELKDGELVYFQYFTYVDGKRVNGIAGTNPKKSFELYTTEGYCEVWYTNKAGVERKFIVNPAPVVTPAN